MILMKTNIWRCRSWTGLRKSFNVYHAPTCQSRATKTFAKLSHIQCSSSKLGSENNIISSIANSTVKAHYSRNSASCGILPNLFVPATNSNVRTDHLLLICATFSFRKRALLLNHFGFCGFYESIIAVDLSGRYEMLKYSLACSTLLRRTLRACNFRSNASTQHRLLNIMFMPVTNVSFAMLIPSFATTPAEVNCPGATQRLFVSWHGVLDEYRKCGGSRHQEFQLRIWNLVECTFNWWWNGGWYLSMMTWQWWTPLDECMIFTCVCT